MNVQEVSVFDYGECSVCRKKAAVGVCCIPGMPYSDAFCKTCLQAGAIPYWAAVCNTAICGGWGQTASWWDEVVWATLIYLNISPVDFSLDVWAEIEDMGNSFEEYIRRNEELADFKNSE